MGSTSSKKCLHSRKVKHAQSPSYPLLLFHSIPAPSLLDGAIHIQGGSSPLANLLTDTTRSVLVYQTMKISHHRMVRVTILGLARRSREETWPCPHLACREEMGENRDKQRKCPLHSTPQCSKQHNPRIVKRLSACSLSSDAWTLCLSWEKP